MHARNLSFSMILAGSALLNSATAPQHAESVGQPDAQCDSAWIQADVDETFGQVVSGSNHNNHNHNHNNSAADKAVSKASMLS